MTAALPLMPAASLSSPASWAKAGRKRFGYVSSEIATFDPEDLVDQHDVRAYAPREKGEGIWKDPV